MPKVFVRLALAYFCSCCLLHGQETVAAQDCAADGRVVNSVTGEPVVRAQILVAGVATPRATVSDSSGNWSLSGLRCGQVQFAASRAGFLQGTVGDPRIGGAFRPMPLSPSSPTHGIVIRMTPQLVITGRVLDPEGDPVFNAQVTVMVARVAEGKRVFVRSSQGQTNDLGEYRVPMLSAGRYVVCVTAFVLPVQFSGGVAENNGIGDSCYPGLPESRGGMDLPAGREARVDFTLPRVSMVKVRGTVSGMPKGRSISVSLLKQNGGAGTGPARQSGVRPDGTFEIPGVSSGTYLANVDYFEGNLRLTARTQFQVAATDVDGVNLRLVPAMTLLGKVTFDSDSRSPAPTVPNFGLSLREMDNGNGGGRTVWGKEGAFTIEGVPSGTYRLQAFPPQNLFVKSATLGGRDVLSQDVAVDGPAGLIEVVLSDTGGSLDVQVEDSDGKSTDGWVLVLKDGRQIAVSRGGGTGRATFKNLPPGRYFVGAWDDNQQVEYGNPDWMRQFGSGQSVTVEAGQATTTQLRLNRVPVP